MTEKKNLSSALATRNKKEKYIIYYVSASDKTLSESQEHGE